MKVVFYKLFCKDETVKDVYVGSTTKPLTIRIKAHKKACSTGDKPYNVYKTIRATGSFDKWDVAILEEAEMSDKQTRFMRERWHIENEKATLNKVIPGRTMCEYMRMYRNKHEQSHICPFCGATYTLANKTRHLRTERCREVFRLGNLPMNEIYTN